MVRKVLKKISSKGREKALYHTRKSIGYARSSSSKSLGYARSSAATFRREFKKHLITAIAAALGFLLALSWREPLSGLTNLIIERAGLQGEDIWYKFISAIIVTILMVVGLIIVTKWGVKKEELKK